jgi:hypothetical protein
LKASELIAALQEVIEIWGDIPVEVFDGPVKHLAIDIPPGDLPPAAVLQLDS